MRAELHELEKERLEALRSFRVLDTPQESDFDEIVALAAGICGTPVSLVSLVDEGRQWFKAKVGVNMSETEIESSICAHAILHNGIFEVPDATQDPRFEDNRFVRNDPNLRFYASAALQTEDGLPIGTLCVLDTVPRKLNDFQLNALSVLARQVMAQLELRRKAIEVEGRRKEAEDAARLLRLVTDRLPVRVAYVDRDMRYVFVNDGYERELGIKREDIVGRTIEEALGPDVFDVAKDHINRTLAGESHTVELRSPYATGTREVLASYVADSAIEEEVKGVVIHAMDVTDQRAAEREFREQQARQATGLETARVATFDWDLPNDLVFGNDLLGRFFGVPECVNGVPVGQYLTAVHPEDLDRLKTAINDSISVGGHYEVQYRTTDATGIERWLLARGEARLAPDGTPLRLAGVILDISDEVGARSAAVAIQERFRQLVELSPATVWFGEIDGSLSYISQDFYETTGMTPEEALPHGWATRVHPEDLPHVAAAWEKSRMEESSYSTEMRILDRNGAYGWISARALPVRDPEGKVTGWLGINSDIQDRKNTEETLRQRVEERTIELQQAVTEAEGFNYSISHDLRAPVRAIVGTASILLMEIGDELSAAHRELLERQAHNANRLGQLIDELLRLSRLSRVEVKRLDTDVTRLANSIARDQRETHQIQVQEGMETQADPILLRTVMVNLIENACKFSPPGTSIEVGQTGDVFWVRDQGIGFDMKYAPKIFLPFERLVLETEFPGTGIGLANVDRIVKRHGGRVWAESEPRAGATFYFTLR